MLNAWDIEFMRETVRDTVKAWNTTITILSPLPIEQQPNYNRQMREYTGEIKFTKLVIPAEHKDIVNNQTNDIQPDDILYGTKNAGVMMYAIPDIIPTYDTDGKQNGTKPYKPSIDDIFIIDASNDRYYLRSMRDRMGETLITICRYVGGTPNGTGILEAVD